MGNFKRGDRHDRGGGDRGGRSDRQMHHAVCSDCGRDCEVPFKPTGDKPVFCSSCFGNKQDHDNSRPERRSNDRSSFREKKMFSAICDECGGECELPFRPSSDKPVYCSSCFEGIQKKNNRGGGGGGDMNSKQFEMLNNKLDNIIKMLASTHSVNSTSPTPKGGQVAQAKKEVETEKSVAKKTLVNSTSSTPKGGQVAQAKKATPKKVVTKKAVKKKVVKKKK